MQRQQAPFDAHHIFSLLGRALPYYCQSWNRLDETAGLFGADNPQTFNMRGVNMSSPVIEYVVRPHVQICCILAACLKYPEGVRALEQCLPADEARARLVCGLRWLCQTHLTGSRDVEQFLLRRRWGENWRSSLWASLMALCSCIARESLPEDLHDNIRRILAFEADRFIGILPPSGCEIDTKLEENAQDAMVMAWACAMDPGNPHAGEWKHALAVWAVNIASCVNDKADHTEYLGRSVAQWVTTQTVYPDMTAENHGFFHPDILSYGMWTVLTLAAYKLNGMEPPEFICRKNHQETFEVLLRFCLSTGLTYAPGGQDLPLFIPRPFMLAWGLWHNDPRAHRLTQRLLSWIETVIVPREPQEGPWVMGLPGEKAGWELFFQSLVGFELSMLVALPFTEEFRLYSSGQIESAVNTHRNYPFVQVCFRRNTRTTRSVAWKALGGHPVVGLNIHSYPELLTTFRASFLGIPSVGDKIKSWTVAFHCDRGQKDGFDTYGRVVYNGQDGRPVMRRDFRVITWGEEGLMVFDSLYAERPLAIDEQYLSPVYLVNDVWTRNRLRFCSGSLREEFQAVQHKYREISCPSFWASIEDCLLVQFIWGRTKGLYYVPGGERNAPPYWKNCRLDMLAVHVEAREIKQDECAYQVGLYAGAGKSPRPFKCTGTAGEFFKGLVVMDGKNTLGLD